METEKGKEKGNNPKNPTNPSNKNINTENNTNVKINSSSPNLLLQHNKIGDIKSVLHINDEYVNQVSPLKPKNKL